MSDAYTLYYRPGACALAPHIVLEWIGVEFDAINAPRDSSYRAINPNGAVPALKVADGTILTQAGAILQFLAEDSGRDDLRGPRSPLGRAQVSRWVSFFTGDFHPAFFPVFVPARYTKDSSDAARAAVKAAGLELVRGQLDAMNVHLEGRTFFVGEHKTIADAYAVPMLRWVGRLFDDGRAGWPAVAAFYDRMLEDEGVTAAMATHGIDP